MEYIRILKNAVGWNWVRIPGIIISLLSLVLALARYFGLVVAEKIPTPVLIYFSAAAVIGWLIVGLLHSCVLQSRMIDEFKKAWDRTGKYDIPIRRAVQFISDKLEKNENAGSADDCYIKAVAKVRELGFENQIRIVGREFDSDSGAYEDFLKQIPPSFWNRNRLDKEVLINQISTAPETIEDEKYSTEISAQPQYGKIQISEATLKAMFPD
jgi:hypothetical protein